MSEQRKRRRPIGDINVVPYIDVMLVLLVIFMVTAPLLTQGIKVDLPQTDSSPVPQEEREPLVVTVDNAGRYYLNAAERPDEPVDGKTLMARTAATLRLHPGTPVYVRGDRQVAYGKVVGAMALLQRAGAPSVGLLTEAPDEQR